MKRAPAACALLAVLTFAGAGAFLASLGLEHAVVLESGARKRSGESAGDGAAASEPPPLTIGTDLLPLQLPGPQDDWAGSRPRRITLRCDLRPGRYRLELESYDAHDSRPPSLAVTLNGAPLGAVQVPPGEGKPGPYTAINPALAVTLPFAVTATRNTFVVASTAGSWLAPARLRITRARPGYNPAKALYLLLARERLAAALAGLLLGGLFLLVCARRGPREALFAVLLLSASLAATGALGEVLFREWLIRKPSQRTLWTPKPPADRESGRHYTYMTMVQPSSEPGIPYEMKPNLDGWFLGHPLRTNSLGMRGPELAGLRGPGSLRILGLGDSVMMGWGVSQEETALTRIGRLLEEASGRRVETANLGCPSYNTAVEAASYRAKGRRLEPDLVILIFMENDFGFPGLMLEPVVRWTLDRSYLRDQLRKQLVPFWWDAADHEHAEFVSTRQFDALKDATDRELTARERWLLKVQEHYLHMVNLDGVRASLEDLAEMIREDGAVGLVVYNPIRLKVGDPGSHEKNAGWVVSTARELGLAAVDMTPAYERYLRGAGLDRMRQGLWVSGSDWHPNAEAHRLIAETVVDLVLTDGLLPEMRER